MTAPGSHIGAPRSEAGLSYIEVVVAMALILLALVPMLDSIGAGLIATELNLDVTAEHFRVSGRLEEILAEPYGALLSAAAAAGNRSVPSGYSDAPGTQARRLVYVALYDPENQDGDGDPFTVPDPDADGDADPFTSYAGLLWVRVNIEGAAAALESLSAP